MTAQELFDKVATHLLTQKARSVTERGAGRVHCAYRGDGGRACAVGCLISDADYDAEMDAEPTGVDRLIERWGALPSIAALAAHEDLLGDLQTLHDTEFPEEWRGALRRFAAARRGLSAHALDVAEVAC